MYIYNYYVLVYVYDINIICTCCIYKDMSIYFLSSDSKASHTLGKCSTTKLQLQSPLNISKI